MAKKPKGKKSVLREWVEALLIALALATFVRTIFFQVYKIPTTSMVPTLMPGDKIFVTKLSYGAKIPFTKLRLAGLRKPKRGEVIVFIPPEEKEKPYFKQKVYIKRLIGLPGERLRIEDGNVYINDKMVTDPLIARNFYFNQGDTENGKEILIPDEEYYFMGDNSISSLDSRYWGTVEYEDVAGKAVFIWWPPKRIGIIE